MDDDVGCVVLYSLYSTVYVYCVRVLCTCTVYVYCVRLLYEEDSMVVLWIGLMDGVYINTYLFRGRWRDDGWTSVHCTCTVLYVPTAMVIRYTGTSMERLPSSTYLLTCILSIQSTIDCT